MVKGKPVDTHAPKRPLSGFFLFSNDVRSKIAKANPKWSVGEVAKEIGKQWGALADAKKTPYQNKADKDKEAYAKKMDKYKKSSNYAKHQEALASWKKEQGNKPFKKDPNRPKRALSAYFLFLADKRPGLEKQGVAFTDVAKRASEMWGKLTEAQKAPYEKKAAKAKVEAQKALEKYMKTKDYKNYMAEKEAYDAKKKAAKKADKADSKAKSAGAKKK